MAISVAGADLQDQVTLHLLLDVIDFGMRPETAVTAPRSATSNHQDSFDPNPDRSQAFRGPGVLNVSDSVDESVREELRQRGHELRAKGAPIAKPVMLYVDEDTGTCYAAGDPAAGRHAAGIEV